MLPGDPRLHALLVFILVSSQAFFTVLAIRNLRYSASTIRSETAFLTDDLGFEDPDRVIHYNRAKTALSHLQSWLGLGALLLVLYTGLLTSIVEWIEAFSLGPVIGGITFFVGLSVALTVFSLPFDVVDTFVIEELFEFNQQTPRLFVRDAIVGLALSVVLAAVVVGAILAFIEAVPTWWWLAGTAFFLVFAVGMQVIYPRVIAPLFNDFEPIESGELRDGVEDVFERAGFRCEELFTMDASRRSSHVNAYFVGFGRTKRVVLFDTLVDRMGLPEIQSVLAHELAHWKRNHVWKRLGVSAIRIAVLLFVLWAILQSTAVYSLFALPTAATYAGLFVALLFVTPLLQLTAPLTNRVSLAHEREADRFAVQVMDDPEPMAAALADLASENLANPFPDPLYAAFHYSHPPIPERIRRIRETGAE